MTGVAGVSQDDNDSDYAHRRLSMRGKVLPVAVKLEPGEHFRDVIMRAIPLNGYTQTRIASETAGTRSFSALSALNSISNAEEIDRLVDVLGLRKDCLNLKKLLENPRPVTRDFIAFFGHHVRRGHISTVRRISPSALRSKSCQKGVWSLKPLTYDRTYGELLVDTCSGCGILLGWGASTGVEFCEKCGFDLRNSPILAVGVEDEEALQFVACAVDPEVSDTQFIRFKTNLKFETRSELFQLVARVGSEVERIVGRGRGQVPTPRNLARAGRAVLDWPGSFCELVDSTRMAIHDRSKDGWFKEKPLRGLLYDPTLSENSRRQIRQLLEPSRMLAVLSGDHDRRTLSSRRNRVLTAGAGHVR